MRLLTEKGAPDWHPAPERVLEVGQKLARYCRDRGIDIADLALQFALQHEYVATTLVGMSKVSHVDNNVKSVGVVPSADILAEVQEMIEPVVNTVWIEGRPENQDPGAVAASS